MQKQKLRTSQQLQQLLPMSHQADPEEQQRSSICINNPSENNNSSSNFQLTPAQVAYLNSLLPLNYSLQSQNRLQKRSTSSVRNSRDSVKAPTQMKKKPTKTQAKVNSAKSATSRGQKGNNVRYTEEVQNAVYEKYNTQKEYRRSNFDNVSEALRPCVRILNLLKNNRTSWPFREPVDPIALGIPHYSDIVKEPMDLSTIQNNLRTNQYLTPTQFHADVSKIITNSYTFNSSNIEFTRVTAQFEAYYRKITAEPGSQLARGYSQGEIGSDGYTSKIANLESKKSKKSQMKEGEYSHSSLPMISMAEKKELGHNIKKLPKEDMKGILDIVQEGTGKVIGEFDLKELDPMIIRKLQVYVKDRLNGEGRLRTGISGDGLNNENQAQSSFQVSEGDQSQ